MLMLSAGSANELFAAACAAVLDGGARVAPRGLPTRELLGAHLRLTDPRRRLVDLPPVRVLNPAFAVAETVWILSGSDEPWIYGYNQRLAEFADHGVLMGAYGPRLRRWRGTVDQLDQVRRLLLTDPDSRRAVVQLFDPARDFRGHRDVPCTLGYRFYLRQGRLHMHTSMRSQDLWLGFCYDLFTATLLQELLAGWLDVPVGEYHHHVDSLHLYDDIIDAAKSLPGTVEASVALPAPAVPWDEFDAVLAQVITGERPAQPGWVQYAAVMRSYRMWKSGDRPGARRAATRTTGSLARALDRWYDHLEAHATAAVAGRAR
jgi:thymidylate synthase